MKLPLEKRDWYISPAMYAELMELYARYAEFEGTARFEAEVISRFGLRPYTEYRITVEREVEK